MVRHLVLAVALSTAMAYAPAAIADDEDVVRLPGKGELRAPPPEDVEKPKRLKPGGGLLISFDADADGAISLDEISQGIPIAFGAADDNGDGYLTALEQQAWAGSLPTRDDSLANPVRFDPNLDRRVSLEEFSSVITGLAADYTQDGAEEILFSNLEAPKIEPPVERSERPIAEALQRRRGEQRLLPR